MKKKGQVTAFIVVGIIVLVVLIGFFSVRWAVEKGYFDNFIKGAKEKPLQVAPVSNFLNSCVKSLTEEATVIVGLQGGYIELPSDSIPTSDYVPVPTNLDILPNSDLKTNVWFRERGNGIQIARPPTKEKVEQEIQDYVNSNFVDCVSNLTVFTNQGYGIAIKDVPKTTTRLFKNKINSVVEFPLQVGISDETFELKNFNSEVDSELGGLYEQALKIFEKQNNDLFLEKKTLNMLVAYDSIVPFSGTDFTCTENFWSKRQVVNDFKNILYENTAAITIKGSDAITNDATNYVQFDVGSVDPKTTVSFLYLPDWPTLVEIEPSEGDLLKGDLMTKQTNNIVSKAISSFFCINNHHFVYDIKYPVLITLRSEDGEIFQFVTEVIIDNNQLRENKYETFDTPDTTSQICQYAQNPLSVNAFTYTPNGEIIPLDEVSVSLKCFPASCPVGFTSSEGTLDTFVPGCVNGIIDATKQRYILLVKPIVTTTDETEKISLILEPKFKKEVKVKIIDKSTGEIREPFESEEISISFRSKSATDSQSLIVPGEINTVDLFEDSYTISAFVLRESTWKITFPPQNFEKCIDVSSGVLGIFGVTNKKCFDVDSEKQEFDQVPTGGAEFEFDFRRIELAEDTVLEIYVPVDSIPSNAGGLLRIQNAIETNAESENFKYPQYVRL